MMTIQPCFRHVIAVRLCRKLTCIVRLALWLLHLALWFCLKVIHFHFEHYQSSWPMSTLRLRALCQYYCFVFLPLNTINRTCARGNCTEIHVQCRAWEKKCWWNTAFCGNFSAFLHRSRFLMSKPNCEYLRLAFSIFGGNYRMNFNDERSLLIFQFYFYRPKWSNSAIFSFSFISNESTYYADGANSRKTNIYIIYRPINAGKMQFTFHLRGCGGTLSDTWIFD